MAVAPTATASHFACSSCKNELCFAAHFICYVPPMNLALHGGVLCAQAIHGSLEFELSLSSIHEHVRCKRCLATLGFKIIYDVGFPSFIKSNMIYFAMEKVTSAYGSNPVSDIWFPNVFMCKNCCTVIGFETGIQILETLQHYPAARVVLNSLRDTYTDEDASRDEGTVGFLRVVCCLTCNTRLGWRRVTTNDGFPIENGLANLVLNRLWFRYCNLLMPAERFISPADLS